MRGRIIGGQEKSYMSKFETADDFNGFALELFQLRETLYKSSFLSWFSFKLLRWTPFLTNTISKYIDSMYNKRTALISLIFESKCLCMATFSICQLSWWKIIDICCCCCGLVLPMIKVGSERLTMGNNGKLTCINRNEQIIDDIFRPSCITQ